MTKKLSKKRKRQAAAKGTGPEQKKIGLLIYVPAFCSVIGTLMLLAVIAAAVPLSLPELFGYKIYNVMSASMEPSIPVGSIIYVKEIEPEKIEKGDVIAFNSGDSVIMHRVLENDVLGGQFTTKGDANKGEDLGQVPYMNLVGIVTLHIPVLGQLLILFGSALGRICMVSFAACGALLNILSGRFADYLKYEKEEERLLEEVLAEKRAEEEEIQRNQDPCLTTDR